MRPRPRPGRPFKKVTFDEPQVKSFETQTSSFESHNQLQEQLSIEKYVPIVFNVEKELERVNIPIPLSIFLRIEVINNRFLNGFNPPVEM